MSFDQERQRGSEVQRWEFSSAPTLFRDVLAHINTGSKIIKYLVKVPLLPEGLKWTQTSIKHWKIWKYVRKKITSKIVIFLVYPNKMGQYCQWNTKCGNLCWINYLQKLDISQTLQCQLCSRIFEPCLIIFSQNREMFLLFDIDMTSFT